MRALNLVAAVGCRGTSQVVSSHAVLRQAEQKVAELFATGTRRASPEMRRRVMASPARRAIAEGIFAGMARSFDGSKGADLDARIRWEVGGEGEEPLVRDIVMKDGRARVERGGAAEPRTTIGLDHATLLELATGLLNAPQAYLAGGCGCGAT